jgi:hypothetical protein
MGKRRRDEGGDTQDLERFPLDLHRQAQRMRALSASWFVFRPHTAVSLSPQVPSVIVVTKRQENTSVSSQASEQQTGLHCFFPNLGKGFLVGVLIYLQPIFMTSQLSKFPVKVQEQNCKYVISGKCECIQQIHLWSLRNGDKEESKSWCHLYLHLRKPS